MKKTWISGLAVTAMMLGSILVPTTALANSTKVITLHKGQTSRFNLSDTSTKNHVKPGKTGSTKPTSKPTHHTSTSSGSHYVKHHVTTRSTSTVTKTHYNGGTSKTSGKTTKTPTVHQIKPTPPSTGGGLFGTGNGSSGTSSPLITPSHTGLPGGTYTTWNTGYTPGHTTYTPGYTSTSATPTVSCTTSTVPVSSSGNWFTKAVKTVKSWFGYGSQTKTTTTTTCSPVVGVWLPNTSSSSGNGKSSGLEGTGPVHPVVIPEYTVKWNINEYKITYSKNSKSVASSVEIRSFTHPGASTWFSMTFNQAGVYKLDCTPISNFGHWNWNGGEETLIVNVPTSMVGKPIPIHQPKQNIGTTEYTSGGGADYGGKVKHQPGNGHGKGLGLLQNHNPDYNNQGVILNANIH